MSNPIDQIRALAGVTQVVRFGQDGRPLGRSDLEAEELAAKALYLAVGQAAAVAETFGLGVLRTAALQGERESFVLVHSAGNYLCVGVAPGTPIEPVALQVRALLSRPPPA